MHNFDRIGKPRARLSGLAAAVSLAAVSGAGTALASPFADDFESSAVGAFPSANWLDLHEFTVPGDGMPSGQVISTTGRDGSQTNAFQIDQRRTTSQGLLRTIDRGPTHSLSADLRIDAHPTPVRGGNWTGGMGFFNQTDPDADINQQAQAVIYSQNNQWFFYGSNTPSDFQITALGAQANAGEWYSISMVVDAILGSFDISILDESGASVVDQTVVFNRFNPDAGAFNCIAFFDGEYDPRFAEAGQFTVDNVNYVPAPAGAAALMAGLALSTRRRRMGASDA